MMRRTNTLKRVLIVLNVLLLVGLAGAVYYYYDRNADLSEQLTLTTEEKNRRLVAEINEVYDLPDEEPIVAIVTDVEEFKQTYPVFDNAETGDYLLFFRKNRLNVLYRQSENKVVKTADVVVPISIELIGPEDAVASAEQALGDFGNQITVTKIIDNNITQSFVYDVDADQPAEAQSVADRLSIQVGSTLPNTITPSETTELVVFVSSPIESSTEPAAAEETE